MKDTRKVVFLTLCGENFGGIESQSERSSSREGRHVHTSLQVSTELFVFRLLYLYTMYKGRHVHTLQVSTVHDTIQWHKVWVPKWLLQLFMFWFKYKLKFDPKKTEILKKTQLSIRSVNGKQNTIIQLDVHCGYNRRQEWKPPCCNNFYGFVFKEPFPYHKTVGLTVVLGDKDESLPAATTDHKWEGFWATTSTF